MGNFLIGSKPLESQGPKIGGGHACTFLTIPFAKLRGNVVRTFLGRSDFYWPLMLLAEQWQYFFANGRVTNRRVPPFPTREYSIILLSDRSGELLRGWSSLGWQWGFTGRYEWLILRHYWPNNLQMDNIPWGMWGAEQNIYPAFPFIRSFSGILFFLRPQPPHTRQKYEQKYVPQTAEFALFWSILGHVLSRCFFIFCLVCGGRGSLVYCSHSGGALFGWSSWASLGPQASCLLCQCSGPQRLDKAYWSLSSTVCLRIIASE